MSDILNNLEKIVKAGFGAASEGLEEAAKAVDRFAEKGEPAYNEAKEKVSGMVNDVKKTFSDVIKSVPETEQIKDLLKALPKEDLDKIQKFLADLMKEAPCEEEPNAEAEQPEEAEAAQSQETEEKSDEESKG